MSAWGGGGSLITMPTNIAPKSLEIQYVASSAVNTNPFTGQQQIQDWQANYYEGSCLLPTMYATDATLWISFLVALNGPVNVFQFTTALQNGFPESLKNGSTGRYFRLKMATTRWTIKPGKIYNMSFEFREAI
jgi:hypothetical protein